MIRSNARRKPRRRPRRWNQANRHSHSGDRDRASADRERLSESNSSMQNCSESTAVVLGRGPECNALDPFDTLPIGEAGNTQYLLFYCEFCNSFH